MDTIDRLYKNFLMNPDYNAESVASSAQILGYDPVTGRVYQTVNSGAAGIGNLQQTCDIFHSKVSIHIY